MSSSDAVPLVITAMNVPLNATMSARVIPKTGQDFEVNTVDDPGVWVITPGELGSSTWEATITLPGEISAIQVRVELP